MLNSLKDYLNRFSFLTSTDITALLEEAKLETYQKGERIVSGGDMNHNIHVVLSGFIRIYVLRADGEERTVIWQIGDWDLVRLRRFLPMHRAMSLQRRWRRARFLK